MIPDTLEYAFHLDLSEKINKHEDLKDKNLKETFEYMRELRNSISHGNKVSIGFQKAIDLQGFFRHLSVKFDKHLVNHFFITEKLFNKD